MKKIIAIIKSIAHDTLKRDKNGTRKWSAARFTMLVSFILVCYSYLHHLFTVGFDMPSFLTMVGLATGVQITDSAAKAIKKKQNPG